MLQSNASLNHFSANNFIELNFLYINDTCSDVRSAKRGLIVTSQYQMLRKFAGSNLGRPGGSCQPTGEDL
jgi:hypothetical protein